MQAVWSHFVVSMNAFTFYIYIHICIYSFVRCLYLKRPSREAEHDSNTELSSFHKMKAVIQDLLAPFNFALELHVTCLLLVKCLLNSCSCPVFLQFTQYCCPRSNKSIQNNNQVNQNLVEMTNSTLRS